MRENNTRGPGRDVEQDKLQLHMGTVRLIFMTVIACFGAAKLIKLLDAAIVTEYMHAVNSIQARDRRIASMGS